MADASRSADEKEHFSRVHLALTDCGRRVLLQLLLRKVVELTPKDHPAQPWSLDDFLNHNMADILSSNGKNKNRKDILYPGFGIKTDLTKWDIPLFVFVLLNACELDYNDAVHLQLKHDIGNLSNLRNRMLHKGAPVLREPIYRNYFDRIVGAVQRLCDYMQEPALKESFLKELKNYASLRHVFQNGLISELGCKSVDMINEADSSVENGLQQMQMIIGKKGLSVNIPVLDVMVMFRNYNERNEQAITERLHRTFSEALEQSKEFSADIRADETVSEVDDVVKSLVRKLFDEKKDITKVSTGCLVLSIQCHDIDAVISLVQDSLSGKLENLFEPLEEVMQTYEDHVLFEVRVGITRKSCWALLNDMFCQVSDECGHRSYTVESTVQGGSIAVRIQRFLQSFTAKELLEKSFSTKEKDEVCKKLKEELTLDLKQPGMDMIILSPKNSIAEGQGGDMATESVCEQKTFDLKTRFLEKDSSPKPPHYKPKTRVHLGGETIEVSKMEHMWEMLRAKSKEMESQIVVVESQHRRFQEANKNLQVTSDPAKLALRSYNSSLQIVRANLKTIEAEVNILAMQVQKEIGSSDSKIRASNEKMEKNKANYDNSLEMIALFEKQIKENYTDKQLALPRAQRNQDASRSSQTNAVALGTTSFAAGMSLVAAVMFTKAAESCETTAECLRSQIEKQREKCRTEKREMNRLKSETDSLKRQVEDLVAVRDAAYAMIKAINKASDRLQEVDNKFHDASQETDAFELVQKILEKQPSNELANEHFLCLKEIWEEVNNLFNPHLLIKLTKK